MVLYANRYESQKTLGCGSFGSVLQVKDLKNGQDYAFKTLPAGEISSTDVASFAKEFEILKSLNHPNICRVFDAGQDQEKECYYLVCELISGKDLFKATESLSLDQIEDLFVQALRAFNYLHEKSLVHLDIKPQNLLVETNTKNPKLKVIDFGFATSKTKVQKKKNIIIGTAAYVAPEIIKEGIYDARADLYSLGIAFYKAFCRRLPFQSTHASQAHQMHLNQLPPKPSSFNSDLPEYLDKILLKLLEKKPDQRYQKASLVIKDLNFYTNKKYEVETSQTRLSYLPETGEFIGRKAELEKFEALFSDRILKQSFKNEPYFIVCGESGVGKTRFLEEIKTKAQKALIQVLAWDDFEKAEVHQIKKPCVVLGDNIKLPKKYLSYIKILLKKEAILLVLAVSNPFDAINCDETNKIKLSAFCFEETKTYLAKATGIENISPSIIQTIFSHTQGNLALLAEYTKTLFERGYFKDADGTWSKEMLEDLGDEIKKVGATEFAKKRVRKSFAKLELSETQIQNLTLMALLDEQHRDELDVISKQLNLSFLTKEDDQFLTENGILKSDRKTFVSPILRKIVLEEASLAFKQKACDFIADHLEKNQASLEQVYHYRGRGAGKEAISSLLKLAQIYKEKSLYNQSKNTLLLALKNQNLTKADHQKILLELGFLCLTMADYAGTTDWLEKLLDQYQNPNQTQQPFEMVKAYDLLGLRYAHTANFDQAESFYNKGLQAIGGQENLLWMKVILKNDLARNEWDKGNVKLAEKLFDEALSIWRNELNEEEQVLAIRSNVVWMYQKKGEHSKAIEYLKEVLALLETRTHLELYPALLYQLSTCYVGVGKLNLANQLLCDCLKIWKERGMVQNLYSAYHQLGEIFAFKKQYDQALVYYQRAFELANKTASFSSHVFYPAYNMATIFLEQKMFEDAEKFALYLTNSFETEEQKERPPEQLAFFSYVILTSVFRQKKQITKAHQYYKKLDFLFQKTDELKKFEQFYLQEKLALFLAENNDLQSQTTLNQLNQFKKTKLFHEESYQEWLDTLENREGLI